jgi:hypothetical protein
MVPGNGARVVAMRSAEARKPDNELFLCLVAALPTMKSVNTSHSDGMPFCARTITFLGTKGNICNYVAVYFIGERRQVWTDLSG